MHDGHREFGVTTKLQKCMQSLEQNGDTRKELLQILFINNKHNLGSTAPYNNSKRPIEQKGNILPPNHTTIGWQIRWSPKTVMTIIVYDLVDYQLSLHQQNYDFCRAAGIFYKSQFTVQIKITGFYEKKRYISSPKIDFGDQKGYISFQKWNLDTYPFFSISIPVKDLKKQKPVRYYCCTKHLNNAVFTH